jgi:L-alanine-DL-glutamate epimerase-like enolase superfamily enzyme
MRHAVRNFGKPGVTAEAISAVDIALWDLRARLLDVPLVIAIGALHEVTPIYGSGGFTS